ncbi:MAG: HEAT repeat domain-containing protein [Planctomycetota bacterium]|jgi:HEAT repeat protein
MFDRISLKRSVAELESTKPENRLRAVEKLASGSAALALRPVISALSDPCPQIRSCAARALVNLGDPRCVQPLVSAALVERDLSVARDMTAALALIGTRAATAEFIRALDHRDGTIRQAAASALRREFWDHLKPDQQATVEIAQNEWEAAASRGDVAIAPLVSAMRCGTVLSKRRSADALASIGTAASCGALREILKDQSADDSSRNAAAAVLKSLNWKPEQSEVNVGPKSERRVYGHAKHPGAKLRSKLVLGMGQTVNRPVNRPADRPADRPSERRADPPVESRRVPEAKSGGDVPPAVQELIAVLGNADLDPEERRAAAEALKVGPGSAGAKALFAALGDKSWTVRTEASFSLRHLNIEPETDLDLAQLAICRNDWDVLVSLGAVAVKPLIAAITFRCISDKVIETLLSIGENGVAALKDLLTDQWLDIKLRETIAVAVGSERATTARGPLLSMLEEPDLAIRVSAVTALRRLDWIPESLEHRVIAAIAEGDWEALPGFGTPALDTLLQMIDGGLATEECVWALGQMLHRNPKCVPLGQLQKLVRTAESRSRDVLVGSGKDVDWDSLVEIGKAELRKRGLFVK